MIVIDVIYCETVRGSVHRRDAIEMRVEQPAVVVIGSRAVPCVDVLKRSQQKCQRESDASQQPGEATHPK